eukprot:m.357436 g.357436  ORF g.357436 m.357436 type:complete len:74 (-) comp17824_c0_seq1:94-315(-)
MFLQLNKATSSLADTPIAWKCTGCPDQSEHPIPSPSPSPAPAFAPAAPPADELKSKLEARFGRRSQWNAATWE